VHGQAGDKYRNRRIGLNARLDTLQAAVLLAKLDIFPEELASRKRVAETYTELLRERAPWAQTPVVPPDRCSAWAQYSIRVPDRDRLRRVLQDRSIPTAVYYEIPLHLQPAFAYLGYREGDMPAAEEAARHVVSLPMHPYLRLDQIQGIVDSIADDV
jgi:dTDP-4-amino-4,6-dideoxygalactose transaminase